MKCHFLRPSASLLAVALLTGALAGGAAIAQYSGPQIAQTRQAQPGDGNAASALTPTTVQQLLATGRDDQVAVLRGRIVSWQGGKHYTLDDGSGQIRLEIKPLRFPLGQKIDDTTEVELVGELERDGKGVTFEVERISVR